MLVAWLFAGWCSRSLKVGDSPFCGFSPNQATTALREVMGLLGYPKAQSYRTQDLRRGHTEDQVDAGYSIEQILKEGEWRYVNLFR